MGVPTAINRSPGESVGSVRQRNGIADLAASVPLAPEQSVNRIAYGAWGLNLPMK